MSLDTFGELVQHCASRVNASRSADIERIRTYAENSLSEVWSRFRWDERRRTALLTCTAAEEITYTSTQGLNVVTIPGAKAEWVGRTFVNLGTPPYDIKAVSGDDVTLARPMFEESETDTTGYVYDDVVQLPFAAQEIIEQEVFLMLRGGLKLAYLLETDARNRQPFADTIGEPTWFCHGPRSIDPDTGDVTRSIQLGWRAPDQAYVVRVPYYCKYPEVTDDSNPIYIPESRRDLAVWLTLSTAYSEYPFADTQQCERWEGKYERELDKALRSQAETDTDIVVVEPFDA